MSEQPPQEPPAGASVPPPQEPPVGASVPPPRRPSRRDYWIGIGLGMIPVVSGWVGVGLATHSKTSTAGGVLLLITIALYLVLLAGAIGLLARQQRKDTGYGLLTMAFVGPVVWAIGCAVIVLSAPSG